MASKTKTLAPIIRHVTTRSYVQASPKSNAEAKITKNVLPSQTFVAALDNGSPVTRVTVAFKAGSRYEPPTELGISHVLRSAAGLSTKQKNGFIMTRKLAQIGASVTASGDREFIYYTLETTHENVDEAVTVLANMLSGQEFRPWELSDNLPRLKFDIAALAPQVRAVDLLHKAAYRRNLGNSLFISPKRLGEISSESLQHYASLLSASNCSIAVVGDSLERANLIAKNLQINEASGAKAADAAKYYSGELRKEMGGDMAHVALAVQGAKAGTPQALALAVAAKALGCGPVVKWGSDNTPLAKAIGNIGPFAAAGFNVSYSDSGLYGVVLSVPKDEANKAVKACAGFLKKPSLSQEAIKAAKNQLKVHVLSEADAGSCFSESLAAQGFYTGNAKSPAEITHDIDALSSNDLQSALSSAASSKLSMGAAGSISYVPYLDEL